MSPGDFREMFSLQVAARAILNAFERMESGVKNGVDEEIRLAFDRIGEEISDYRTSIEKQDSTTQDLHNKLREDLEGCLDHGSSLEVWQMPIANIRSWLADYESRLTTHESAPKLWITYAWTDNAEGDFGYLVQKLEAANISTTYDRVALIPGRRLWEQIEDRITDQDLDGWAILITAASLASQPCREELAYALQRTLDAKGADFPLIGLVHGVAIHELPLSLRTRLLVPLSDPDWPESVASALRGEPLRRETPAESTYRWKVIGGFRGDNSAAVWVRPRFERLPSWRIFYPSSAVLIDSGPGAPQKSGYTGMLNNPREGTGSLGGEDCGFIGSHDPVGPENGCYIVLSHPLPKWLAFCPTFPGSEEPDSNKLEQLFLESS